MGRAMRNGVWDDLGMMIRPSPSHPQIPHYHVSLPWSAHASFHQMPLGGGVFMGNPSTGSQACSPASASTSGFSATLAPNTSYPYLVYLSCIRCTIIYIIYVLKVISVFHGFCIRKCDKHLFFADLSFFGSYVNLFSFHNPSSKFI